MALIRPAIAAIAALAVWVRSDPPLLISESALQEDRLEQPWNHFLLDGSQAFVAGRVFYQARAADPAFIWPSDPYLAYVPDTAWLADSGTFRASAGLGNEIGDAMLQELATSGKAEDNRTPYTAGRMSFSPDPRLRAHAGFDQNDHSSYRTSPARNRMVGASQRDAMAWFGGNIPPRSAADAGIAYAGGKASASYRFLRGWWWTTSPVSGQTYPWEGRSQALDLGLGKWKLSLREEAWDSPAQRAYYAAEWSRRSALLSAGSSEAARAGWKAAAGLEARALRSDSAFAGSERMGFPFALTYWRRPAGPDAAGLKLSGSARSDKEVLLLEQAAEWEEEGARIRAFQRLEAYYRRPLPGYGKPVEHIPGLGSAVYREGGNQRGFSAATGFRKGGPALSALTEAVWAGEWQAPIFRAALLDTAAGSILRAGTYGPSSHALWNGTLRMEARGEIASRAAWRLEAGGRRFFGAEAGAMEFRPSRYWATVGGTWDFPSDLRAEARVHRMGSKEVRGWGPVFKIPAHFENDLGLAQTLPGGHALLRLSLLHAFGSDLREHPNGNPVRFRVLGGAEARF